jgi:para-aminobenzoate synthetase component 1
MDPSCGPCPRPLALEMSQHDYEAAVPKPSSISRLGDVFQVNLSLRFTTQTQAHSWSLYRKLHQ